MNTFTKRLVIILGLVVVAGGPAYASKPYSPGNGGPQASQNANSAAQNPKKDAYSYFNLDRRSLINNHYSSYRSNGKCPPGLAKKNNGCMPPGQAKKWLRGDQFPRDLPYYDLPHALLEELGRTPEGEKIIRVGSALLLINIGTQMVLDVLDLQE
jgi:hypothetical protein